MSVVTISNLTKTYNNITAIDTISLQIEHNNFHCIVGPNGSGKSTMFRLILGLTNPTSGTITTPHTNNIGGAFQTPSFYPSLTVNENISIFQSMTHADDAWIDQITESIGLQRVMNRVVQNLSGGYKKKLDIVLGVLHKPELFVLDEPLADLDDVTRTELVAFLRSYVDDNHTVVVATHNVDDFAHVLDRLTIMEHGTIKVDAEKSELQPQSEELHQMYVDMVADVETNVTSDDMV